MKNEEYIEYKDWRNLKRALATANKPIPETWNNFKNFISDIGLKPNPTDYIYYTVNSDTSSIEVFKWRNYLGKPNKQFPEYSSWKNMRARCTSECLSEVRHYQSKGITVCDRWNDFQTFYEDMGPKPSPKHSIDRIDNNGNYEPSNCRWATDTEQNRNKHNVKVFTYGDFTGTIPGIAEYLGINSNSIHKSMQRGNSITEAVDGLLKYKA